jgi:hypothetical protein
MSVSQKINNVANELIKKASNETLTQAALFRGLINIKELAADVANLETVAKLTQDLKQELEKSNA